MTRRQILAAMMAQLPKLIVSASLGREFSNCPKLMKGSRLIVSSGVAQLAGDVSTACSELKANGTFKKMGVKYQDTIIEGNWTVLRFDKGTSLAADMATLANIAYALNAMGVRYSDKPFAWAAFKGANRKYRYIAIGPLSKKFNGYNVGSHLKYRNIKIK